MAYGWGGMEKIEFSEVERLHQARELEGVFKLFDDGSEALIEDDYVWEEVVRHWECGGEFGVEELQ